MTATGLPEGGGNERFSIRKFVVPVPFAGVAEVKMPEGSSLLSVGAQRGRLVVWAQVPYEPSDERTFRLAVLPTGDGFERKAEEVLRFLGTVQVDGEYGEVVWHVYHLTVIS